jgi:hypothetical protein
MRPKTSLETKATFWLARRLPSCDAVTATLSQSLERPLTRRERIVRRLHFLYCDLCRRYERQLRLMRRSVRLRASTVEVGLGGLSSNVRARIGRTITAVSA